MRVLLATAALLATLVVGSIGMPTPHAPAVPTGPLPTQNTLLAGPVKPIQPGGLLDFGSLFCTQNLIFKGHGAHEGESYVGTAAHCVSSVGQVAKDENGVRIGTVAAFGDSSVENTDWALIKIDASRIAAGDVALNARGWPGFPSGIQTLADYNNDLTAGIPVLVDGYGLGFDVCDCTRENRIGLLTFQDAATFECIPCLTINGDSGSAIYDYNTGKAIGIVSRGLGVVVAFGTNFGPTFEGVMPQMAAAGIPVTVALG